MKRAEVKDDRHIKNQIISNIFLNYYKNNKEFNEMLYSYNQNEKFVNAIFDNY